MAAVYLAIDETTGEEVALKLLDQEVGQAMGADRFKREIRIATSLEHPHILRVLDAGDANGQLYFTMPVVTGQSLDVKIEREEQLPIEEAVRITREVASALAYAHERGIVHRDIKPENILMQDGRALLADFGIARASTDLRATQMLTRTGMSLGTPTYMSPEQSAADRELDGRTDQYSLACVLYEMLAGQPPFTAKSAGALMARHMLEPVPSLSIVRGTVPEQVEDAIVHAMNKAPADRFATITEFADALGTPDSWPRTRAGPTRTYTAMYPAAAPVPVKPKRFTRRSLTLTVAGVAIAALGVGGYWWVAGRPRVVTPAVLLAVAPFNPLRPEYALWKEGMVDVLARNLDGAGPIGTVSPAVAIRGWGTQRADRKSARALAERTGARWAVYGSINAAPGQLVQLSASLLDVSGDSLWESSWTGIEVQALADSATRFVLSQLGERYAIGASRSSPLGSTSVEALKAFLQGEQQFRRTAWRPAAEAYQRAAALDTGFALPLRRMGQIIGFERSDVDPLRLEYALRAGRLNRGLAPRDSALVAADSLFAALAKLPELSDWPLQRRLFATLDNATKRYPADPEVWFAAGESRYHFGYGTIVDITDEQVYDAFQRAVALDSGFAPAYIHGVELAFRMRGRAEGRRHAEAYLALNPTDRDADGVRLLLQMTDPAIVGTPELAKTLDSLPLEVLKSAMSEIGGWPDSAATAITLVRAVARKPSSSPTHADDSTLVHQYLPLELAYRGRLKEAYDALGTRRSRLVAEIALLGGLEADTAAAVFGRWVNDLSPGRARSALPYWAEGGFADPIQKFLARVDSASRFAKGSAALLAAHDVGAARAYLALASRDTTKALKEFSALSDTLCLTCYVDRLTHARLLAARGKLDDADRLLRQRIYTTLTPMEVLIALERGRVARRRNDEETAIRSFSFVVNAWQGGDPEVQAMVAEARAALAAPRGKPAAGSSAVPNGPAPR